MKILHFTLVSMLAFFYSDAASTSMERLRADVWKARMEAKLQQARKEAQDAKERLRKFVEARGSNGLEESIKSSQELLVRLREYVQTHKESKDVVDVDDCKQLIEIEKKKLEQLKDVQRKIRSLEAARGASDNPVPPKTPSIRNLGVPFVLVPVNLLPTAVAFVPSLYEYDPIIAATECLKRDVSVLERRLRQSTSHPDRVRDDIAYLLWQQTYMKGLISEYNTIQKTMDEYRRHLAILSGSSKLRKQNQSLIDSYQVDIDHQQQNMIFVLERLVRWIQLFRSSWDRISQH